VRARHVAVLALLSAIWGASYLLITYAIRDMPEPLVVVGRTALAALALVAYIRLREPGAWAQVGDLRRRPGTAALLGLTAIGAPFLLITYGERTVPSGLTAVLIAAAPIFIAAFAPFLDRSEIMRPAQVGGLVVGLLGVGLLVGFEQVDDAGELLGAIAMILAAASYGVSGFVLKRGYPGVSPSVTSLFSVATSAVIVLPLALARPPAEAPGIGAVLAVVALGLLGTALAFVLYFRLIGEIGFGRASVVAYTIPPVALVYGVLLLDESLTPAMLAGMALILGGVALVARGGPRSGQAAERAAR
jgi:drug/metabolite transporter (DMT)-like permease